MTRKQTTPYRKKGLSVFLTVIMVLSVVAMSAAFVGSVAASDHDPDEDDITYGPSQFGDQAIEVTFDDSAYDLFDVTSDGELEDNFTVWDYSDTEIQVNDVTTTNDERTVEIGITDDLEGGDAYLEFVEQSVNVSIETASTYQPVNTDTEVEVFAGEHVAFTDVDGVLTIDHPDGEYEQGTGANSTVHVLDTSDWEAGDTVNVSDDNNEIELTLRGFGIDVETDSAEYGQDDDIVVTADADRVERDMVINLYDDDGERVAQAEETSDASGELSVAFDASDLEGDYTAAVYDKSTWISGVSDEFSVEEVVIEDPILFGETTDAAQGDIVEIELLFEDADSYGDGDVNIFINESDYNANVTLDLEDFDGDSLVLEWNTYQAGNADAAFNIEYDNASVASVTDETVIDREAGYRLNPGGYTMSLYADGGAIETLEDSTSVTVADRHLGDVQTSIVPGDVLEGVDEEDHLAYITDNATSADSVAQGDYILFEQEVTGVYGYAFDDDGTILDDNITIEFADTDVPAYQDPDPFNASDENVTVVPSQEDETVYIWYNVSEEDELGEGDIEEWEYEFKIAEDNVYVDDDESVTAAYEVTERMYALDLVQEPYQITPTEDGVVTGYTTLAPGSEISVQVNMPGVDIWSDDVTVTEDRTWTFSEDFSDREVGEEVEITVGDNEPVDGVFADTAEADTVTDVQQLEQQIADLEDQISQLEDDLAAAEQERDDAQAALDGAQEEIDDLEQQVEDLQSDLDDAQDAQDFQDAVLDIMDEHGIDDLDDLSDALDDANPAFGPIAALFALLAGGALIARRRLN